MKYLSLDVIDSSENPRPDVLRSMSITMRGTKNLFDIFFSAVDLETSFNISLPPQIDFTWINTPSGKEKYLSYPTIKRVLFPLRDQHQLVEPYLAWIDSLLFANHKMKAFFRTSYSNASTESMEYDNMSDIDDINDDASEDENSSVQSFESTQDNEYVITALQHKVDQLQHQLELKHKDVEILERDVQLRDKEIEFLKLKLSIPPRAEWV